MKQLTPVACLSCDPYRRLDVHRDLVKVSYWRTQAKGLILNKYSIRAGDDSKQKFSHENKMRMLAFTMLFPIRQFSAQFCRAGSRKYRFLLFYINAAIIFECYK
jgi:hypothetical protein